jgi:hypothetical protein
MEDTKLVCKIDNNTKCASWYKCLVFSISTITHKSNRDSSATLPVCHLHPHTIFSTTIMPDLKYDPKMAIPDLSGKVILITGG